LKKKKNRSSIEVTFKLWSYSHSDGLGLGLGATKDLLCLHPLLCFCNAVCCIGGIRYKRRVVAVDDGVKSFWLG